MAAHAECIKPVLRRFDRLRGANCCKKNARGNDDKVDRGKLGGFPCLNARLPLDDPRHCSGALRSSELLQGGAQPGSGGSSEGSQRPAASDGAAAAAAAAARKKGPTPSELAARARMAELEARLAAEQMVRPPSGHSPPVRPAGKRFDGA